MQRRLYQTGTEVWSILRRSEGAIIEMNCYVEFAGTFDPAGLDTIMTCANQWGNVLVLSKEYQKGCSMTTVRIRVSYTAEKVRSFFERSQTII